MLIAKALSIVWCLSRPLSASALIDESHEKGLSLQPWTTACGPCSSACLEQSSTIKVTIVCSLHFRLIQSRKFKVLVWLSISQGYQCIDNIYLATQQYLPCVQKCGSWKLNRHFLAESTYKVIQMNLDLRKILVTPKTLNWDSFLFQTQENP